MSIDSAHNNTKLDNLLAIRVENELIRRTHVTKYFCLIVDDTLKWDLHIDYKSKKMKKNIGVRKHVKSCVPKEWLAMLYKTHVEPYLRCCNTTWRECGQQLISKHRKLERPELSWESNMRRQIMIFFSHLWGGWMLNNLYIMILPPSCIKLQMELHQSTHSLCLINMIPFIRMKQDQQETEILLLLTLT